MAKNKWKTGKNNKKKYSAVTKKGKKKQNYSNVTVYVQLQKKEKKRFSLKQSAVTKEKYICTYISAISAEQCIHTPLECC